MSVFTKQKGGEYSFSQIFADEILADGHRFFYFAWLLICGKLPSSEKLLRGQALTFLLP